MKPASYKRERALRSLSVVTLSGVLSLSFALTLPVAANTSSSQILNNAKVKVNGEFNEKVDATVVKPDRRRRGGGGGGVRPNRPNPPRFEPDPPSRPNPPRFPDPDPPSRPNPPRFPDPEPDPDPWTPEPDPDPYYPEPDPDPYYPEPDPDPYYPEPDPDPYYPEPDPDPWYPDPDPIEPDPDPWYPEPDPVEPDPVDPGPNPDDYKAEDCDFAHDFMGCQIFTFWWPKPHKEYEWKISDLIKKDQKINFITLQVAFNEGKSGKNGVMGIRTLEVKYQDGTKQDLVKVSHKLYPDNKARNDQIVLKDAEDLLYLPLKDKKVKSIKIKADSWIAPKTDVYLLMTLQFLENEESIELDQH